MYSPRLSHHMTLLMTKMQYNMHIRTVRMIFVWTLCECQKNIARFVVRKLKHKLKCEYCIGGLVGNHRDFLNKIEKTKID